MKLNLGGGDKKYSGFLNVDISPEYEPDVLCDLRKGIPIPDNSVEEIIASHIIEHLPDTKDIMNEIWRVCKNNAIISIIVPHERSLMAHADPTHKRVFNEESFKYFCLNGEHYWIHKSYGIKCKFILLDQEVCTERRFGYLKVTLKTVKNNDTEEKYKNNLYHQTLLKKIRDKIKCLKCFGRHYLRQRTFRH